MRYGLLLFLILATAVPLRICGADEKPARPVPAAQKKAVPVPLRVFPPRPGLRNTVDPQPQQPTAGLVLADRKLVVRLRRARAALAAQKFSSSSARSDRNSTKLASPGQRSLMNGRSSRIDSRRALLMATSRSKRFCLSSVSLSSMRQAREITGLARG